MKRPTSTDAVTMIECKYCKNEYEKNNINFYNGKKDKLDFSICKTCKKKASAIRGKNINIYQMYKEKIKIYHREYNRKNKKKCECCNREYSIINYYSHNKTKKHLLNMSKNISATSEEQT